MASTAKTMNEAVARTSNSIVDLVGDWIRQGTEGFIATQKILLDLAAQQNALVLTIVRERLGVFSSFPTKATLDFAGKGIHNFIEVQQVLLDLVLRQNTIIGDGLKPALQGTPAEGLGEVLNRGIENFVSAQKHFLVTFEKEAENAISDLEAGKGFDTERLSNLARAGMRDFIKSQKKFLDIVDEELVTKKPETPEGEGKKVEVVETAKQSVDAFVEFEKRLLDLAADQVNVNVEFARELFTIDREHRPKTTLPEMVKKSVDSFVAAQKALVDVAAKPRKHAAAAGAETEPVTAKAS